MYFTEDSCSMLIRLFYCCGDLTPVFKGRYCVRPVFFVSSDNDIKQKRSTEGCSKFKSPEIRQVQERLVSTLEHMQVPKWDRTRCPEESASPVGMPHPLQMPYGNLYSVITSKSVKIKSGKGVINWCNV